MRLTFNPEAGDLGRAPRITEFEEIPKLIRIVAEIFADLRKLSSKHLCYGIEFQSKYKQIVNLLIHAMELPDGVGIYTTDKTQVFDIRNHNNELMTTSILYLVAKPGM